MESEESLAVVVVPNGILLPSIILRKSAKSWLIIAKNSLNCGSTPSPCLCCSYIARLVLLHLSLTKPGARHSVTSPLPPAPADPTTPCIYHTLAPLHPPHTIAHTQIHTLHHHHAHTIHHIPYTHHTPHTIHIHPHTHHSYIQHTYGGAE